MRIPFDVELVSVMYMVYVIQGRLVAPGVLLNYSLMSPQVRKLHITAIFVVRRTALGGKIFMTEF